MGIANIVGVILCYVVFYMPMNLMLYSGYLTNIPVALEEAGIKMAAAEVTMIPQTYVELTDEKDIAGIQKTLDMLDDDDDVQDVYHNWDE